MKKILFLYLKTGGGHLAPAKAIHNHLNTYHYDKVNIKMVDGFENANDFTAILIEKGYKHLQSKALWLYESLYALHKLKFVSKVSCRIIDMAISRYLDNSILTQDPDKIVLFHFFLISPVLKIIEKNQLKTKVIVVVTDPYTAHPIWFL